MFDVDDCATTAPDDQHTLVTQSAVGSRDRVPMHTQVICELPDRREISAGHDAPAGDGLPETSHDLLFERLGAVEVDLNHDADCIRQ